MRSGAAIGGGPHGHSEGLIQAHSPARAVTVRCLLRPGAPRWRLQDPPAGRGGHRRTQCGRIWAPGPVRTAARVRTVPTLPENRPFSGIFGQKRGATAGGAARKGRRRRFPAFLCHIWSATGHGGDRRAPRCAPAPPSAVLHGQLSLVLKKSVSFKHRIKAARPQPARRGRRAAQGRRTCPLRLPWGGRGLCGGVGRHRWPAVGTSGAGF